LLPVPDGLDLQLKIMNVVMMLEWRVTHLKTMLVTPFVDQVEVMVPSLLEIELVLTNHAMKVLISVAIKTVIRELLP